MKRAVPAAQARAAPAGGVRADAQRNLDALLDAAKTVFASAGVDAPVREIAAKAGVGVATVYRHFPQRSDLVAAVFRSSTDCVTPRPGRRSRARSSAARAEVAQAWAARVR